MINKGKYSPIPFSLAALMVPSTDDQQGQIFPNIFLPGCSHGSLSCRSTGENIPPFLSPWLLSCFHLLLINRGNYCPHSYSLAEFFSCRSTGANIPPFLSPWLLSWLPLLLINRDNYCPHFLFFGLSSSPADQQGQIFPFLSLADFMVPSPADQQGEIFLHSFALILSPADQQREIFPHFFLFGYSHGQQGELFPSSCHPVCTLSLSC
jgi:hypothetical protein